MWEYWYAMEDNADDKTHIIIMFPGPPSSIFVHIVHFIFMTATYVQRAFIAAFNFVSIAFESGVTEKIIAPIMHCAIIH